MRKLISIITSVVIVTVCMPIAVVSMTELGKYLGFRQMPVPVVGTGSMYPSLFWEKSEGGPDDESKMSVEEYRTTPHMYHRFSGIPFNGNIYLKREIKYGDMVAFANAATQQILDKEGKNTTSGFIKRVIGVGGDTLELRDGFVYKNGVILEEPYIYKPRSTYGDTFLSDCEKLTVPMGKYFVMGDNRKTSSDSRGDLGLVDDNDITYSLPYQEQKIYQSLYRDTSKDSEMSGKPTLSTTEFITLLNSERTNKKLNSLTNDKLLSTSAVITGNKYLTGDKKYPLGSAISAAGYHNIVLGEFLTLGHYDATELLQNLLYFPETAKQILDNQFQDIGVAAVTREVNGCPTQVIVGHLGGYIPAQYDKQTVQSWIDLQTNLESVIPSWERARQYQSVDQNKLGELLTILNRRLNLAREIVDSMRNNKWLTDNEEVRIKADDKDASLANELIDDLNKGQ